MATFSAKVAGPPRQGEIAGSWRGAVNMRERLCQAHLLEIF